MYEVVCPDGRVRHTPYVEPEDAEAYARFANRAGDGELVIGVPCEPNLSVSPACGVALPGNIQTHWVRVVETGKPLLASCPICGAWPSMPEEPTIRARKLSPTVTRDVVVGVPCPKCPAAITYYADTGFVCCVTPNQPLTVRNVGSRSAS
jgi:hypothetical protein